MDSAAWCFASPPPSPAMPHLVYVCHLLHVSAVTDHHQGDDWEIQIVPIDTVFVWATCCRGQFKCDHTRAETRSRLSAKRTSPFKSAGASVQSVTGSRRVRISGSNAGYTMFRGSTKGTGYPLHSPVSPSLPLPCVTVCHHISTGVYKKVQI